MQQQELAAAEEKELKWIGSLKKLEMSNNIIVCVFLFLPDERKLNSLLLLSHFPERSKLLYLCNT